MSLRAGTRSYVGDAVLSVPVQSEHWFGSVLERSEAVIILTNMSVTLFSDNTFEFGRFLKIFVM